MVYHFELQVPFQNQTRQNNGVTQIRNYLAQFETDLFPAGTTAVDSVKPFDASYKWGADWRFAVSCRCRFMTKQIRDDLWAQLDTALGTGNNGPIAGSARAGHALRYDINADDPSNPDQSAQNVIERVW